MAVVKWIFEDYFNTGPTPYTYTLPVNPNDGGSPTIQKNMNLLQNSGPNRAGIVLEGPNQSPVMGFSGVIITQAQYETLEIWFNKRILIKITDDLGRQFYGVFSKWNPKRTRRASNFWYHTYDCEFTISSYFNASGQRVYGKTV